MTLDQGWIAAHVRDVADFPKPGVVFKDITPLLGAPQAFRATVDAVADAAGDEAIDKVAGIEARGFLFAAPVAYQLRAGFVPVRKRGKLPFDVVEHEYDLEYGTDVLAVHTDAFAPGEKVLIVDDVLATGGTARATVSLVERAGAEVVGLVFVLELGFLGGRARLDGRRVTSLLRIDAP